MLSSRRLHGISITEAGKVLFPDAGYTKADVTAYYDSVSHYLLSHLKDRPLVSEQCEVSIDQDCWRQRGANDDYPSYVHTAFLMDPMSGGASKHFPVCQNVRALIYLTERGMLTPHLWLSRYDQPEMPDRLAFVLQGSEERFRDVCEVAYALSSLLHDQGLVPFVMTDGLGGLIVIVPIRRRGDFSQTQPFVRMIAERLAGRMPGLGVKGLDGSTLEEASKEGLWLDIGRNQHGGTVVAPYALRAMPDAPVAIPLDWMELSRSDLAPTRYSLRNLHARLRQKRDPWRNLSRHARTLP